MVKNEQRNEGCREEVERKSKVSVYTDVKNRNLMKSTLVKV